MDMHIRPLAHDDMPAIVQLSLLAWEPVFRSFEQVLGRRIFARLYSDWRRSQQEVVEKYCLENKETLTWVAEAQGKVAGFIVYTLNNHENGQEHTAEVDLLAVHPDYQNHGLGTALNNFALEKMREAGIQLTVVGTGGDPGHAPARRTYEKAGYTALPLVRYYQNL